MINTETETPQYWKVRLHEARQLVCFDPMLKTHNLYDKERTRSEAMTAAKGFFGVNNIKSLEGTAHFALAAPDIEAWM